MRRSLLLFRRLRCFFEADSRTPFRHSPLREETAFREKPHFPCKGSSPPLFLLPSRRNSSPAVRPPSLSAAYRRSASTQPATHRKPCFRHDVFASRPFFEREHRSIRLEKPCIETVQEKTCKRGVSPTPLFHAPLRSPPCPMLQTDVVRDRDKREASRNTEKLYSPASRRIVFGLSRSEAEPSPPEHPTSTGEERIQRGISLRKNRETDRSSIPQPPDECPRFRAAAKPNPPNAGVPMRTEQETIGQGPPTKYR